MHAVARSAERTAPPPADRLLSSTNQQRVDEAYRALGLIVARVVASAGPTSYVLDLASQDGTLQAVWGRDARSAAPSQGDAEVAAVIDPTDIAAGACGAANAERYLRAQKALSCLLVELMRPECDGSATLRLRGCGGELDP